MNPDVPERERTPVPKRRWKPLEEPDRRSMNVYLADAPEWHAAEVPCPSWGGH